MQVLYVFDLEQLQKNCIETSDTQESMSTQCKCTISKKHSSLFKLSLPSTFLRRLLRYSFFSEFKKLLFVFKLKIAKLA